MNCYIYIIAVSDGIRPITDIIAMRQKNAIWIWDAGQVVLCCQELLGWFLMKDIMSGI